ncbi:MAG: GAP family protein [Thermaerobacter sp.]|nr:hypothetical protein [Bacillota bacterium]
METLLAIGGLALLDSINPSALLATLYLLKRSRPAAAVTTYMAGVFVTYFTVAVLLMLGLEAFVRRFEDALYSPAAYAVQLLLGAAMLVYSFVADPKKGAGPRQDRITGVAGFAALFALGVVITLVEMTSAFPLFAAVGVLTYQQWPIRLWLPVLVGYTVIFVLPPFLLLFLHQVVGRRLERRFAGLQQRLERAGHEAVLWIIGIIGFYLTMDAVGYFLVHFNLFGLGERPPDESLGPWPFLASLPRQKGV